MGSGLTLEALLEHVTRTHPDTERVRHFEGLLFGSVKRRWKSQYIRSRPFSRWWDRARNARMREMMQKKGMSFWDDGGFKGSLWWGIRSG